MGPMTSLDEDITVNGQTTNLLRLAGEGRLVLRRSGSYRPDPASEPRAALWADLIGRSPIPGTHGWEIGEDEYAVLRKLGVRAPV